MIILPLFTFQNLNQNKSKTSKLDLLYRSKSELSEILEKVIKRVKDMAESPESDSGGGSGAVGGRGWGYCAVPGCPPSRRSDHVRFHRVPTVDTRGRPDPRREKWLQACSITDADERGSLVICSKHFLLQDYKPFSARLIPGAVPSQNLPHPPEENF